MQDNGVVFAVPGDQTASIRASTLSLNKNFHQSPPEVSVHLLTDICRVLVL